MTVTDKTLALLAILGFAGFLGIVMWFVQEIDLIIVCVLGILLASFDFLRTFLSARRSDR